MATTSRLRFVRWQVAWMVGAVVLLTMMDALTLPLFLAATLVGLFLLAEVTMPFNVTPTWRSRLRWVVVLGVVAFGVLVVARLIEVLPSGVL